MLKRTSFFLDNETRKLVDDYSNETGLNFSDSLRKLITDGLNQHSRMKSLGTYDTMGPDSLMLNEQRALKASIEGLYILRMLAKDNIILDEASKKADEILKSGWRYGNK